MRVNNMEKILTKMAIKELKLDSLEDLLNLSKDFSSADKTKLWSVLPSQLLGSFIPHIPYTAAITLLNKAGNKALDKLHCLTDKGAAWPDVDDLRNNLLYPGVEEKIVDLLNIEGDCCGRLARPDLLKWSKINSGRDLFIAGLGNFDILKAIKSIKDTVGLTEARYLSYLSVENIQAAGYFNNMEYHFLLREKNFLKHIVRHWSAWKEFGFEHTYEIKDALRDSLTKAVRSGKYLEYSPRTLFLKTQEAIDKAASALLKAESMPIDSPFKRVILPESEYNLKIIHNAKELNTAGIRFNNCIGSRHYAIRGIIGSSLFIVVEGTVPYICDLNLRSGKINQVVGKNNSKAPANIRKELTRIGIELTS